MIFSNFLSKRHFLSIKLHEIGYAVLNKIIKKNGTIIQLKIFHFIQIFQNKANFRNFQRNYLFCIIGKRLHGQ